MKTVQKTIKEKVPEKGDILKTKEVVGSDEDNRIKVSKVLGVINGLFFMSKPIYEEDIEDDDESYKFEIVEIIYTIKRLKEIFNF